MDMRRTDSNWILTYTGKKFYPTDPRPDEICIEDIAHALANLCRYAGHAEDFYSVAEHSCLVAENAPPSYRKWALLHDATEAYTVDLPRPIKRCDVIYRMFEEELQKAIAAHFGLTLPIPDEVLELDSRILLDERAVFFKTPFPSWGERRESLQLLGVQPQALPDHGAEVVPRIVGGALMRLCPPVETTLTSKSVTTNGSASSAATRGHTSEQDRHIGRRVQTTADGRQCEGARVLRVFYDDEDES
jgi:hypothetical protein